MQISTTTYGQLTVATIYLVKFAVLQRIPEYIKVTAISSFVTFQYCDSSGNQIAGTQDAYANLSDFVYLLIFD